MSSQSQGSPESNPSEGAVSTNPARGRKGNDSLWKRARRTLGTSSLTFLQPQNRPSKGKGSDSAGPAAPSKRREQVRHAQRTHRQRTQNYIKTLESEVVRLRSSENALLQEKNNLQGKVDILRTTCLLAGVALPAGLDDTAAALPHRPLSQDSAKVSFHADDMSNQRLHVEWPSPVASDNARVPRAQSQAPFSDASPSPFSTTPFSGQPQASTPQPLSFDTPSSQALYADNNPLLDTPDVAIDFVLALEHPCMSHVPHPSTSSPDPTGHILLASTPLVASSATAPQLDSQWSASASMIKELLNLSSSINLKGELTPVEAWHRLRGHPNFWKLDLQGLSVLKRELSGGARCCGFGAVLDEAFFWQTLGKVLPSGRHF